MSKLHEVVLVEGARTPFLDSGGAYSPLMTYQLGALALRGVLNKTGLDAKHIDMVTMGTVLHEVETSNVARESMIEAGLPLTTPAYTTSMAGLSASVGFATLCDMIALGRIDVALASGTESFSDIPLRLAPKIRRAAMKLRQNPTASNVLKHVASLRPADLKVVMPTGTDFTTRKTMGVCAESMVEKFDVSRQACDEYTVRSHRLAIEAQRQGLLGQDIVAVQVPGQSNPVTTDDTPRADCTLDRISKHKPVFKSQGVITAAGSSRFTDGSAAVLVCSRQAATAHGLKPKARVVDYVLAGVHDLHQEMLLGPAMAIPKLLAKQGLKMTDIDVWELHEAFAAQILANVNCMQSNNWANVYYQGQVPGALPLDKLNAWGGSLSLGNPFAATGMRLLSTAANRLVHQGGRYAMVSSCAGGGLGAAILLENLQHN